MKIKRGLILLSLVLVLVLASCTTTPSPAPTPTPTPTPTLTPTPVPTLIPTPTPTPTPQPGVTINSPLNGSELLAGDVMVSVSVSDFSIVSKLGQPNAAGEGHIHYYLDAEPPTIPGQPAVSGPGTYAVTPEMSHTWQNVTPGSHTLGVQLVNNNHTPLEPPVVAKVTVNVSSLTVQPVTVNLIAQNSAFDKSSITVPAGAAVTIVFNNMETDYHNFALYQNSAAANVIFVGEIIIGPRTITYQFNAPSAPGTYFFRCDVHPFMSGTFIVQ